MEEETEAKIERIYTCVYRVLCGPWVFFEGEAPAVRAVAEKAYGLLDESQPDLMIIREGSREIYLGKKTESLREVIDIREEDLSVTFAIRVALWHLDDDAELIGYDFRQFSDANTKEQMLEEFVHNAIYGAEGSYPDSLRPGD